MADEITRLIRLAQNPALNKGGDDDDGTEDWKDEMDEAKVDNGRTVSGPRTKLAAMDNRLSGLEKSISSLAKATKMIAKNQEKMSKGFGDPDMGGGAPPPPSRDPMETPPPAAPAGALALAGDGKFFNNDGPGYPDENNRPREYDTNERDYHDAEISNAIRVMKSLERRLVAKSAPKPRFANKAVVNKDDSTGDSFGEKDDDLVGNRPFDQTERASNGTLINGDGSDGPGPITKSFIEQSVNKSVSDALASVGLVTSSSPSVGGGSMLSKSSQGVDKEVLQRDFSKLSFSEINRARDEIGDFGSRI